MHLTKTCEINMSREEGIVFLPTTVVLTSFNKHKLVLCFDSTKSKLFEVPGNINILLSYA